VLPTLLTANVSRVRPGKQSLAWLKGRIAEIKGSDPLAPVTVVVASNHVGLAARRGLARDGYANVRFGVVGRLVEPFGAPALAEAGKTPLTLPSQEAAIREAVRRAGQGFGDVGQHPALVRALADLFSELRHAEVDADRLQHLATWGVMANAALEVYREYTSVLEMARLYDDQDLLASATKGLSGASATRMVGEIGAVVVYLPTGAKPAEIRFFKALSGLCPIEIAVSSLDDQLADVPSTSIAEAFGVAWSNLPAPEVAAPEVNLLAAPDATEEVRSVVRQLLSKLDNGTELRRIAIVYRDQEPYGPLVRDTLDAAGVPWAGIDGRPLSQSWAGRGLLGLLRLRGNDFARIDVLAWLGTLPAADPGRVSLGDWDRQSRRAAVVHGARQWQDRLRLLAKDINAEADGMEHEGASDGAIRYRRREAGVLERMARFIEKADTDTRAPADPTWAGFAAWAEKVRRYYVPVADQWPERERQADEMISELLIQLASASAVEQEVDLDRFTEAAEATIESRRQAEGRLGSGVAVGPISAVCGMEFDIVFVVGGTERALPHPASPDPVFPPDGGPDPLGRTDRRKSEERRDFLAAVAAGQSVCVSFAAWDADLRPSYPSPWVVDLARKSSDRPVTASDLRLGKGAMNLLNISSPDAGLTLATSFLNVAEWRAAMARRDGQIQSLSRSGLAARQDLPLHRHLEVRMARASDAFTEFDGNVESEVGGLPMLASGLDNRGHSPSSIEEWAACPFSYLLDRVIRVEPTERPEQEVAWAIGSLARGTLVHEILSRFFDELAQTGRPRAREIYGAVDRTRIEEIAREEFKLLEETGAIGHKLAWDNERQAILTDLQTFLREDEELRSDGLVPQFFEQGFGTKGANSWNELVVELSSGRVARLRGRIDRIDLGPNPSKPQEARLIDYKTGSGKGYSDKDLEADPVAAGTKVQPSIYAAVIRSRFPAVNVRSGYWFVSAKGNFKFVKVRDDPERLRQVLDVVDRGLRAGAFPQVPGPDDQRPGRVSWTNCMYCSFDRICPTGRDQMRERKRDRPGPLIQLELSADRES
jgi:ATP-dependent helicase/nuclease subunit B